MTQVDNLPVPSTDTQVTLAFRSLNFAATKDLPASLTVCEELLKDVQTAAFWLHGRILRHIKESGLYKEHSSTFEAYLQSRWNLSKAHGYRLIEAAEVMDVLSGYPIGDLPQNEAQARALKSLVQEDPDAAAEAWKSAVDSGPVTAKRLREAISKVQDADEEIIDGDIVPDEGEAVLILKTAVKHLQRTVEALEKGRVTQAVVQDTLNILHNTFYTAVHQILSILDDEAGSLIDIPTIEFGSR